MAKIIAVANLKGGVGKSVLSTNLAFALRDVGRVVVVDTDNQQSARWWSRKKLDGIEVVEVRHGNDRRIWARALGEVGGDLIVIDCGSNDPEGLTVAFAVAHLAVVPCVAAGVDLKATQDTLHALKNVRTRRKGMPQALLVPSRVDRRRSTGREIEAVLHDFGEPVAPAIMERVLFSDAFTAGTWIGDFAPRSAGHMEIEALAAIVRRRLWPASDQA